LVPSSLVPEEQVVLAVPKHREQVVEQAVLHFAD
jgi:hypothetical protein